jgi:23S rRNA (pseudouridine1915-N3)-methyltransferase
VKVTLIAVGKIRDPFTDAEAHYLKMLRGRQDVEVVEVKDDSALERRIDKDAYVVGLDLTGKQMDSESWSRWLDKRRHAGQKVTMLIGGPTGLSDEVRGQLDETLSLGKQTIAHQLARINLLEQLFRAAKIIAGEPYHL